MIVTGDAEGGMAVASCLTALVVASARELVVELDQVLNTPMR